MKLSADTSELIGIAKRLRGIDFSKEFKPYFRESAELMNELAFAEAPNVKGQLARSITIKYPSDLSAVIGSDDSVCPYAKFVYNGTKAHTIRPRVKKALAFVPKGSFDGIVRGSVKILAIPANPYLLKTFKKHEKEFISDLQNGLKKVIEKE
jgi:phage gpG-like protein